MGQQHYERCHPYHACSSLTTSSRPKPSFRVFIMTLCGSFLLLHLLASSAVRGALLATPDTTLSVPPSSPKDTDISHFWGQYSPFFSVPSPISAALGPDCRPSFAQVLSRHGARFPTASKSSAYSDTIRLLKDRVRRFDGPYSFLNQYSYSLGSDDLTDFGKQQMISSGRVFYHRYEHLARNDVPFVRSSGEERVVDSARNFNEGFHAAKVACTQDPTYPYDILVIPEGSDFNNTLDHGTCDVFEDGPDSEDGHDAQSEWAKVFVPPIRDRLNHDLAGANLTDAQTVQLMDLCPFETVARPDATQSPFCKLFSPKEWHQYAYYETLGKYYGYGNGNPLGPTQGVGFVNELQARLTGQPVEDDTNTNRTLDQNPATFPLNRTLYADFSHDNDMTSIYAALGLYNSTVPLPTTHVVEAEQYGGYSSAWTVPFAARIYIEKLVCKGHNDELVRVVVNDRVQPLKQCQADEMGRCTLTNFIRSLDFAQSGGQWDQCFQEDDENEGDDNDNDGGEKGEGSGR